MLSSDARYFLTKVDPHGSTFLFFLFPEILRLPEW